VSAGIVLFDAGGTLFTEVESRDDVYARVLGEHGARVSTALVGRLRTEVHDAMPESFAGAARYTDPWFREFVRRLLERLSATADPEEVRRQLAEHFQRPEHFVVFPDTLPALEELGSRGLRLGVVSNWSDRLHDLLDGLLLARHFEVVTISALAGASKPDRALFLHALRQFGAAPGQALHVGDHPVNDLLGARRSGLSALLLDRDRRHGGELSVIHSLEEVPGRLHGAR
jgi:putative hydrolase of the HAD superfamily